MVPVIRQFPQYIMRETCIQLSVAGPARMAKCVMARGPYSKDDAHDRLRIREARLRAGLTQEELAEAMGISPPSIGRWERGLVDVSVKQLLRLSEILKVPPSEFIDGGDGLTDEERDLIAFIRANPVHRKLFLGQMEVLQESPPDVAAE